ncbi:uncharacterized protein [Apostichopus japonicus]|uniref:uncharacterized protein isoform X1 n=1 Tax=Stichopus japonicus TaxID=307972 RepID=UPI003AB1D6DE
MNRENEDILPILYCTVSYCTEEKPALYNVTLFAQYSYTYVREPRSCLASLSSICLDTVHPNADVRVTRRGKNAVTSYEESDGDEDHVPVCKRHNTSKGQQAVTTNEESDGDEDHIPVCNRRNTSKGQKVRKYTIWEKNHEKEIHHRNLKDDARSKKD